MQTKEYKEKMRKIALEKGYGKWGKGKKQTKETIEKRVSQFRGDKHWNWNSGLKNPNSNGGELRYWKKQALIRDDFTCQICGLKDPEIVEVDHIKSKSLHPELKNDIDNLVTMCANCHRRKTLRDIKNKAIRFRRRKNEA